MKVRVLPGYIFKSGDRSLTEVSSATLTISAAHATNPRQDVIEINAEGTIQVKSGTAASPALFPTLTTGFHPLAVIYVPAQATLIHLDNILDLRLLGGLGYQQAAIGVEEFTAVGTYVFTAKKTSPHVITCVGGGGGGGAAGGVSYATGGGGGGGGETTTAIIQLTEGVNYTVVVGLKGFSSSGAASNGNSSSLASGATTFIYASGGVGGRSGWESPNGGAGGGPPGIDRDRLSTSNGADGGNGTASVGGNGGGSGAFVGSGGSGASGHGDNATGYGGGGGGGCPGGAYGGGNGTDGYVRISY